MIPEPTYCEVPFSSRGVDWDTKVPNMVRGEYTNMCMVGLVRVTPPVAHMKIWFNSITPTAEELNATWVGTRVEAATRWRADARKLRVAGTIEPRFNKPDNPNLNKLKVRFEGGIRYVDNPE